MKKQILTFILSAVTLTASAITWQGPVPVFGAYYSGPKGVYLFNVGKKQFLAMGEKDATLWRWRAILDSTDVAAVPITIGSRDESYVVRTSDNNYYLGYSGNNVFFTTDSFTGVSGIDWAFPEMGAGDVTSWSLVLGWDPDAEDTDIDGNPTGTNQTLYLVNPNDRVCESNWDVVSEDNYQLYLSQKRLYRAAVVAEAAGVDYTAYTEIYEYGRKDQLDAASEELEAASNTQAILENRINTATLDNPQDVTALMVNPDFTTGNTNGWVLNMPNATDLGYQNNSDYTHGEANLTGFIQAWHLSNALENGSLTTTINLLPAGRYRLEADVVATCQTKPATDDTSGCQLFVSGFALDQGTDVATANNSPRRFAVDFTLRGGALTLGLRARNTDSNWLAGDNFRLTYYGKSEFPEGDLNEDGEVNVADITKVVNIALKKNNQE